MANGIKIGGFSFDAFKIGSADVDAAYIGDTLVYSGGTPPTPTFTAKWIATFPDTSTSSADCDSTSAITSGEIYYNVASVEIGECVTSIDSLAFADSTMYDITISNSVTSIGDIAFARCFLESVTIPSGVTSIGERAFFECYALMSITVEATTPPSLGAQAFDDTGNCPIYVPSGSVNTYKSASGWSDYASRIQAIPNS